MHFTGTKPRPILLVPNLALDSVDVKTKKMFSSHRGFLTIARNNLIKLTHYDETKNMAHDSQIV